MIYYCEKCRQYWRDQITLFIWDWVYTLNDGTPLMVCPDCKEKNKTNEISAVEVAQLKKEV